jgi:hypothetical protein
MPIEKLHKDTPSTENFKKPHSNTIVKFYYVS